MDGIDYEAIWFRAVLIHLPPYRNIQVGELKLTGVALVAALDYADVVKYLRGETATADQVRVEMSIIIDPFDRVVSSYPW